MYPNLYYVFKDWFGVEWPALAFLNTFGLMVAVAFAVAALVLTSEFKRKEKLGLLQPREEIITVGKPASFSEILINLVAGFLFGYKLVGLFFSKPPGVEPQDYIFSGEGSWTGGILLGLLLAGIKWYEKKKQQLKEPENRPVRIWPHDRVGDIIILGLVFGILGAKLFDNFENWDEFIAHPIERIFSASGLTFYGGLILAAIAICWFAYKKGIPIGHLVDSAAPALLIAYAIGRIGCQVSGDGDWGVYNSAYSSSETGKIMRASDTTAFNEKIARYADYFLEGRAADSTGKEVIVTDRVYPSLSEVPHRWFQGPSFMPNWFFAYTYPKNVNKDGILIPGDRDDHNRMLPSPVFPTPLYEILGCTILFLFLWGIRKSVKTPFVIFGIYLVVNGIERFLIERIRVNRHYDFLGMRLSQAEIIAIFLVLTGLFIILAARMRYSKK
ncbi:MAG: prolipoprotein diacylglyceryl transferase [Chitinophagaceae bacterium]|nr:prolipoprotein diacylglyceryl transferase [Bacteroidota bacterium]MCC6257624.1 prolipoprotein diacylglyceryl transferase [Chitinophagaceae bacterium]